MGKLSGKLVTPLYLGKELNDQVQAFRNRRRTGIRRAVDSRQIYGPFIVESICI